MRASDRYPIIITRNMVACRDFYVRFLGFEVGFAASWFTWLATPDGSATIAFMTPDHPSRPPGAEEFSGLGMCFELQVDDAMATFAELTAKGLPVEYPLTDEPFGQRRFGFHDPAGLWIDVVEQIEPEVGYWDRYLG
jgi:catechol 2,3-dioxygenase-like lactoylglutathione lyase family enzyme